MQNLIVDGQSKQADADDDQLVLDEVLVGRPTDCVGGGAIGRGAGHAVEVEIGFGVVGEAQKSFLGESLDGVRGRGRGGGP